MLTMAPHNARVANGGRAPRNEKASVAARWGFFFVTMFHASQLGEGAADPKKLAYFLNDGRSLLDPVSSPLVVMPKMGFGVVSKRPLTRVDQRHARIFLHVSANWQTGPWLDRRGDARI